MDKGCSSEFDSDDHNDSDFASSTPVKHLEKGHQKRIDKNFNYIERFLKKVHLDACKTITYSQSNRLSSRTDNKKYVSRIGNYTKPCADLKILHGQNTKKISREKILKNTKSLGIYKFNNNTFIFENSSIFDSMFEVFASAYRNLTSFQNYCNEELYDPKTPAKKYFFLNNVISWCKNGNFKSIYAYRARMILKHGQRNKTIIFLREKLADLFVGLIGSESFLMEETVQCNKCGEFQEHARVVQLGDITKEKIGNIKAELFMKNL